MELVTILPLLMFVVLGVMLFSGYPVAFVLGGVGLMFGFIGIGLDVFKFPQFFLIVSRIYGGTMENPVLVAVPMFIFMGTMLERSGIARELLHALQVLTRRVPGGLALSVTLMGTVMAATTGIIGASVVMITLMALPVMIERQYHMPFATGTIAASGTLGILIPPSIMLVIMGDLLSVPVGTLFLAAVMPGLLLSGLYVIYVITFASARPALAPPLPEEESPQTAGELASVVFNGFLPPVLLIVLVLGSIFGGYATPTEAAGVGAAGATILALVKRKLGGSTLKDVTESAALTGAMLFGIFVGATCFSFVFRMLGGDELIVQIFNASAMGPWAFLATMMLMVFILGFFFDWIEITLIVLPIFAPLIQLLDFGTHLGDPTLVLPWFAILVAINLQTSFLTPPFGFALFYMKGVAPPEVNIRDIYKGIIPFVLVQLLGLGAVIAFPQIALWLPRVLLD